MNYESERDLKQATVINPDAGTSSTVLNDFIHDEIEKSGRSVQNTVQNTDVQNEGVISAGTMLCDVYEVQEKLNIVSGEADLYICTFAARKYVAKVYKRKMAIKHEVAELLAKIRSMFVARIFAMGEYNGFPVEIIPYYMNGSIYGKKFSFDQLKYEIIPSINEGLHVLHENGIIHKDIKPSNIMLNNDGRTCAIIDFGISSFRENGSTVIVTRTGLTPEYSAPETFRNLFLNESDYYSFGITIYELFCGHTPYSSMEQEEIEQFVSLQKLPMPSDMPGELQELINALTYPDITNRKNKENPNRRWGYDEINNWCNDIPQPLPGSFVAPKESPKNVMDGRSGGMTGNISMIDDSDNNMSPYHFAGKSITKTSVLSQELNSHWTEGKKHLLRGLLLSHFKKESNAEIISYLMDFEEEADQVDSDILLFRCLYALDPNLKDFCWKGKAFGSLPELGDKYLTALRENDTAFMEMMDEILNKGVLSTFYTFCIDASATEHIDVLRTYESEHRTFSGKEEGELVRRYRLAYLLASTKDYFYAGKLFSCVTDFADYIQEKSKEETKPVDVILRSVVCPDEKSIDPQYICWLEATETNTKFSVTGTCEIIFLRSIYILYPHLKALVWNGYRFENLQDFGNQYLANLRADNKGFIKNVDDMITKGIFCEYLTLFDMADTEEEKRFRSYEKKIRAVETDDGQSYSSCRYELAYSFASEKDFVLGEHRFTCVDELVTYLHHLFNESFDEFDQLCYSLLKPDKSIDPQLEAWLRANKMDSRIKNWRKGENFVRTHPEPAVNWKLIYPKPDESTCVCPDDYDGNNECTGGTDSVNLEEGTLADDEKRADLPRKTDSGEVPELFSKVEFGSYPQTGRSGECQPISWIVVDKDETNITLLSTMSLDCCCYHDSREYISWESCDLRQWLNHDFVSKAFTAEQMQALVKTEHDNCDDAVFLMSYEEIENLNNQTAQDILCVSPTEYAQRNGAKHNAAGQGPYWTRVLDDETHAYMISGGGNPRAVYTTMDFVAVRPAIVVDVAKYKFG